MANGIGHIWCPIYFSDFNDISPHKGQARILPQCGEKLQWISRDSLVVCSIGGFAMPIFSKQSAHRSQLTAHSFPTSQQHLGNGWINYMIANQQ